MQLSVMLSAARLSPIAGLTLVAAPALRAQAAPDLAPYLTADRAAEIALARTAAPANISATARILVLTPKGFVEAVAGTNGFTCVVMRSFGAPPGDPQFWNAHIRAPMCLNPPAARSVLPALLAQVDWAIAGATAADLKARARNAYDNKRFTAPADGAMAYMLSPQQHLSDDDDPHWMPHLMFYYSRTVTAPMIGASGFTAPVIDASAGDPDAPVQLFFIPVRNWSDGTPAVHPAPPKH
jgi:hypothetical protein